MALILRPPRTEDELALRQMHAQLAADDFDFLLSDGSWEDFLAKVAREAAGQDLPPGRVPAEWLVAEVDGTPVGRVSIRHELTPFLLAEGGHVGYAVAPEFRRRGYASEILRQSVARLAALGVDRVLVTCDDDNAGSAAVIESCGGVLDDVRETADGPAKRRYWITSQA